MIMHARLGHPGERVMQDIHNHVDGINKLRKLALFKCGSCILVNATKHAVTQNELRHATRTAIIKSLPFLDAQSSNSSAPCSTPSSDPSSLLPGQVVKSTKYQHCAEDGHLVTSLDGFNGYVLGTVLLGIVRWDCSLHAAQYFSVPKYFTCGAPIVSKTF
jgi:hypothetical protein